MLLLVRSFKGFLSDATWIQVIPKRWKEMERDTMRLSSKEII